jgi:nucleotide-binding universal stress UspA family protein
MGLKPAANKPSDKGVTEMTCFVPYDGSELATAALEQATTLGVGVDADIVVATVIPQDREYAAERGWIDNAAGFDGEQIEASLRTQVAAIAPDADFRATHVNSYVSAGNIATRLRDIAVEIEADIVFLGSENVGSIAAPVSSIGSNVATRVPYDIYLVQSRD